MVGSRKRNSRVRTTTTTAAPRGFTGAMSTVAQASAENPPLPKKKRKVLVDLPVDHEEDAIAKPVDGSALKRGGRMQLKTSNRHHLQPSAMGSLETVKEGHEETREPIASRAEAFQEPLIIAVDSMDCSSDEGSLELETNNETPGCPPHERHLREDACIKKDAGSRPNEDPLAKCEEDSPTDNELLQNLRKSNVDNPEALAAMLSSQPTTPIPPPPLTPTGTTIGGERLEACASLDGSELTMLTFDKDEIDDTDQPPEDAPRAYATQSPYFPPASRSHATTPSTVATTPCQQFHSPRRTNISSATKSARQGCLDILQGRRLSDPRDNSPPQSSCSASENGSLPSIDPKRSNPDEMMSPLTQEMFPSKHHPSTRPNLVEDGNKATIIKLDEPPAIEPKQIFFEYDGQLIPHPILPPGWDIHISKTKQRPFYTHPDHGTSWHCPVITPLCPSDEQLASLTKTLHPDETKELLRKVETAETESLTTATDVTSLGSSPGEMFSHPKAGSHSVHNQSNENDFSVSTVSGEINTLGTMRRAVTIEHSDIALMDDSHSELLDEPLTTGNSPGSSDISPTRDNTDILDHDDSSSDEEIAILTQRNAGKANSQTVALFPSQRIHCVDDIQPPQGQNTPGDNEGISYNRAAEEKQPLATNMPPAPITMDQGSTSGMRDLSPPSDYAADNERVGSSDDSDVTASGGSRSQSMSPREVFEEVVLQNAAYTGSSPNLVGTITEHAKRDTASSRGSLAGQPTPIPESKGRSPSVEDDFPNDDGHDDDNEEQLEESLRQVDLRGTALEGRFDDAMSQVDSLHDDESASGKVMPLHPDTDHNDTHGFEEDSDVDNSHDEVKEVASPPHGFGDNDTESEDMSQSEPEGSGPCPEDVDVRSVDSISTLGTHKRSISTETFLSKFSVRILNPPHPICHLQRLDELLDAQQSMKRGRIYGRAGSKLNKSATRTCWN